MLKLYMYSYFIDFLSLTLCGCGNESVTIISIHRWTNQAIIIQTRYMKNYW